jgi:hypothetical protein
MPPGEDERIEFAHRSHESADGFGCGARED